MKGWLLRCLVAATGLYTLALLSGGSIHVQGLGAALFAVVVIGAANAVVRPLCLILKVVTIGINVLTLGLFSFLVSAFVNVLVFFVIGRSGLVTGFEVTSVGGAVLGSVGMAVINAIASWLIPDDRERGRA